MKTSKILYYAGALTLIFAVPYVFGFSGRYGGGGQALPFKEAVFFLGGVFAFFALLLFFLSKIGVRISFWDKE